MAMVGLLTNAVGMLLTSVTKQKAVEVVGDDNPRAIGSQINSTKGLQMIHRICAKCGKMESVDFGVVLDDDFYCTECDLEMNQKEINNEKEKENE